MQLLDVNEIAKRLGCSPRTVWRFRDTGRMPAPIKIAGFVRWKETDIDAWIEAGCPVVRRVKGGAK